MEPPQRDPEQRPEALFALRHWTHLVLLQCDRLFQAAADQGDLAHLPKHDLVRETANHLVLGERAELDIHKLYPGAWPYRVQVKDGDVLLGGSLKLSEIQQVAEQLYLWIRDPRNSHPLVDVPTNPHTHGVSLDAGGELGRVEPIADALTDEGFVALTRNLHDRSDILVLLTDPVRLSDVERIARSADPDVVVGGMFAFTRDDEE